MATEFSIWDDQVDETTHVVAVRGEIDIFTAPEFKQRISAAIDAGRDLVVVDLGATTFIDSSSLGVLISAHRRLSARDGRLVAEGWGTLVGYDYVAGRATPFPERVAERLRAEGAG